jgi:TRAP-type mannitol/chloroaromatic compound transport system substrate-binding protein
LARAQHGLGDRHPAKDRGEGLPADVVKALRATTADVLNEAAKKDPQTRKVHELFFAFKRKHDKWSEISEESVLVNART